MAKIGLFSNIQLSLFKPSELIIIMLGPYLCNFLLKICLIPVLCFFAFDDCYEVQRGFVKHQTKQNLNTITFKFNWNLL